MDRKQLILGCLPYDILQYGFHCSEVVIMSYYIHRHALSLYRVIYLTFGKNSK
jgi:hypothetical protein